MKSTILFFAGFFLLTLSANAQFAGGTGTAEDPYQVADLDQLQEVGNHLDQHFIQTADINAEDTQGWNEGMGFEPIGAGFEFTGTYDGDGYVIENLIIFRESMDEVGLFSRLAGGTIRNVALIDANITGDGHTGSVLGFNNGGTVSNSYTTGNVSGGHRVGGLVGTANPGTIENSNATANVSGSRRVGGLVGHNQGGATVINSYATGNVSVSFGDGHDAGGLVGANAGAEIHNSYATGFVTAIGRRAGGLVGQNHNSGIITNSYATGIASASDEQGMVGGFVGRNRQEAVIEHSYAIGSAYSDNEVDFGGFAGLNDQLGEIIESYWDSEASDNSNGVGGGETEGLTALNTAQMSGEAAPDNMGGFDFTETWKVTDVYPALSWEEVDTPTSAEENLAGLPRQVELGQNYPNPFNPSTQISFALPVTGHVSLEIFDITGQNVATLINSTREAGHYTVSFDGSRLASGIYLYRIQVGEFVQVKKMMLIK